MSNIDVDSKQKIYIVIVTYNRIGSLKKCVQCIHSLTQNFFRYIIVDNASTDETKNYCTNLAKNDTRCIYIQLPTNTGGSGGFYTGIKFAYEDGADFIWGMDDDAYPDTNSLEILWNFAQKDQFRNCYWSNADADNDFEKDYKSVPHLMFVGFFISRDLINRVGLPRKDFFIYLDDIEYSYRIKNHNYDIIKIRDSKIKHTASGQLMFPDKCILGIKLRWSNVPNWKYYYWVRNYVLMYPWTDKNKYITITIKMLKIFLMTLIFNKQQLKWFLVAYKDGIFGQSGIKRF